MYKWIGNSHYCTAGIKKSDGIEQLRTYKSLKSCSVAVSLYDIENCGIPDPGLCWVGSDQHSRHLELLYCLGGASLIRAVREEEEKVRGKRGKKREIKTKWINIITYSS
jgi:hypothetical protein